MKRALLIDTETQGLDPAKDRCIEVACILYDLEHTAPVASYASLIEADDNAASAINRIAPEILKTSPKADGVWDSVGSCIDRADVIVAHRAEFDRAFVPPKWREMRPWTCSKFHIEWPLGKLGDDLVHLALAHGVGVVHAHRAMTDCDILARLFTRAHEMGHDLAKVLERAMRQRVRLVAMVSYDDREKAKANGFAWSPERKEWWRDMPKEDVGSLPFKTREAPL